MFSSLCCDGDPDCPICGMNTRSRIPLPSLNDCGLPFTVAIPAAVEFQGVMREAGEAMGCAVDEMLVGLVKKGGGDA